MYSCCMQCMASCIGQKQKKQARNNGYTRGVMRYADGDEFRRETATKYSLNLLQ